jgi:hypothetical protein
MATFKEIQAQVLTSQNRKEVLNHIVNYLEENFRPNGADPKNFLLKEDRTPVPDEAFESVVTDLLLEVQTLDKNLKEMLEAEVKQSTKK